MPVSFHAGLRPLAIAPAVSTRPALYFGKSLHDAAETDAFYPPDTSETLARAAQNGTHRLLGTINKKLVISDADRKRLREYAASPDGKIFAMNHSTDLDVFTVLEVSRAGNFIATTMGTVELFQTKMLGLPVGKLMPKIGGLSVNRKARDKSPTINESQNVVRENRYPLFLCPEGYVTNANRTVFPLKDGASQIALHNVEKYGQRVNIIPISVYYHFKGDLTKDILARVETLEKTLGYTATANHPVNDRIEAIFEKMVQQREAHYGVAPVAGENAYAKLLRVREHIVDTLECRYLNRQLDDKGTQEIRSRRLIGHIRREMDKLRAAEPQGFFKRLGYKPSAEHTEKLAAMQTDAEMLDDVIDLSMYEPGYPLDNTDAQLMMLIRLQRDVDIVNEGKWLDRQPIFLPKYPVDMIIKVGEPVAVHDVFAANRGGQISPAMLETHVSQLVRDGLQRGIDAAVAELPG